MKNTRFYFSVFIIYMLNSITYNKKLKKFLRNIDKNSSYTKINPDFKIEKSEYVRYVLERNGGYL